MSDIDWQRTREVLGKEFSGIEVGHRTIGGGAQAAYIDARAVFERLDEALGPGNWSSSFRVIDAEAKAVECTISAFGVSKADVGYPNSASDAENDAKEPWKAAYSDAVKRCAVHWGIGRYLYPHPGERGGRPAGPRQERPQATPHPDRTTQEPQPRPFNVREVTPPAGDEAQTVPKINPNLSADDRARLNANRNLLKELAQKTGVDPTVVLDQCCADRKVPRDPGQWDSFAITAITNWLTDQLNGLKSAPGAKR